MLTTAVPQPFQIHLVTSMLKEKRFGTGVYRVLKDPQGKKDKCPFRF